MDIASVHNKFERHAGAEAVAFASRPVLLRPCAFSLSSVKCRHAYCSALPKALLMFRNIRNSRAIHTSARLEHNGGC